MRDGKATQSPTSFISVSRLPLDWLLLLNVLHNCSLHFRPVTHVNRSHHHLYTLLYITNYSIENLVANMSHQFNRISFFSTARSTFQLEIDFTTSLVRC